MRSAHKPNVSRIRSEFELSTSDSRDPQAKELDRYFNRRRGAEEIPCLRENRVGFMAHFSSTSPVAATKASRSGESLHKNSARPTNRFQAPHVQASARTQRMTRDKQWDCGPFRSHRPVPAHVSRDREGT